MLSDDEPSAQLRAHDKLRCAARLLQLLLQHASYLPAAAAAAGRHRTRMPQVIFSSMRTASQDLQQLRTRRLQPPPAVTVEPPQLRAEGGEQLLIGI